MPSKELTEKVARAIYEHRHKGMKNIWSWDESGLDDEHPGERERYIGYAQAAISTIYAALQEPDQSMLGAAESMCVDGPYLGRLDADLVWGRMLAASALGEKSE
ncbi:hypothetical protein NJB93_19600 [Brucella intermedia]|uniref:hypothetical protein n=1 Tax=Brucella intermedia TaxID=94625 RepID=UPI00209BB752|nr:hypothetical protein [Brucella intermedia]MCO7728788.1 hypothetical protein [Brucella intermedia]